MHIPWRELVSFPYIIAITQLVWLLFFFKKEDPQYEEHNYRTTFSVESASSLATDDSEEKQQSSNIQDVQNQRISRLEKDSWK